MARRRDGVENHVDLVRLYEALVAHTGLACLDASRLEAHQPWWALRAELLRRAGDPGAAEAYRRAIALTHEKPARRWLEGRARASRAVR